MFFSSDKSARVVLWTVGSAALPSWKWLHQWFQTKLTARLHKAYQLFTSSAYCSLYAHILFSSAGCCFPPPHAIQINGSWCCDGENCTEKAALIHFTPIMSLILRSSNFFLQSLYIQMKSNYIRWCYSLFGDLKKGAQMTTSVFRQDINLKITFYCGN